MRFSGIILLLLFSGLLIADPITEGGNVTEITFLNFFNSTNWDGFYGEVVLGNGTIYYVNVSGNRVAELDMAAQEPPCTYSSIRMHVIAVNDTGITGALSAGNIAALDAFIGNAENGSNTFNSTSTFQLTYGTIAGVPTTYTMAGNATSPDFRMGYLNDGSGNLVFATVVVDDRPNWNGSTSDYQIMLPNNGSVVQYTVWVDVNYTCAPNVTPGEDDDEHILYIPPIGTVSFTSGEPFGLGVTVENRGDYREDDVLVWITDCPAGFSCGTFTIPHIIPGGEEDVVLPISGGPAGTYVLEVCAESESGADYCREFILVVLPECETNEDCPENEYCDNGGCEEQGENGEECSNDYECLSGVCEGGECAECVVDADCAFDEFCSAGICEKVVCGCGYIVDHRCVEYECCMDADCETAEMCYQHECIQKELDIVVIDGTLIEGDPLLVQVLDNLGRPVPGAIVTSEGISIAADPNGYATVATPYEGIIFGEKEGYGRIGELLDVTRIGTFVFEKEIYAGEETVIRLVDSRGNPIAGAQVFIDGEMLVTDSEGRIRHVFREEGKVEIRGRKQGYLVRDGELTVLGGRGAAPACYYPFLLGWFGFTGSTIYVLWIFSILLALANLLLLRRKLGMTDKKALLFAFTPLVLAIPNYWLLSICVMSNVVAFQAVSEILLALKRRFGREGEAEEEMRRELREEDRAKRRGQAKEKQGLPREPGKEEK